MMIIMLWYLVDMKARLCKISRYLATTSLELLMPGYECINCLCTEAISSTSHFHLPNQGACIRWGSLFIHNIPQSQEQRTQHVAEKSLEKDLIDLHSS